MGKKRQPPKGEGSEEAAFLLFGPPHIKEFQTLRAELSGLTDRAVAIVGGAYLEWRVRQTIKHRLPNWEIVPTGKTKAVPVGDIVFGNDEVGGELGFLSQCRMAYCLGLVGPIGFSDLQRVAKVRNRFAHHVEVSSFNEDTKVMELCEKLESPALMDAMRFALDGIQPAESKELERHRVSFIQTVEILWFMLYQIAQFCPVDWPDPKRQGLILW